LRSQFSDPLEGERQVLPLYLFIQRSAEKVSTEIRNITKNTER